MTTPILYTGQQFRELRRSAKCTVYRLWKLSGVSQRTIAQFESGRPILTTTYEAIVQGLAKVNYK